ncbi:MAG: hypothetical protein ACTSVL_01010 [Promethearchaeota archaeon]
MSSSSTGWAWPWWTVMVIISIINVLVCAVVYKQSLQPKDGKDSKYRKRMRIMGVIFTMVAVYRSVFVTQYGSQRAWFDCIANSSLLVRCFAIAAELSFSGLIAFSMLQFNKDLPAPSETSTNKFKKFMTEKSPYILIICIFIAQFPATIAVITKMDLLGTIEETLWTIGFLAILPLAIIQLRRVYSIKDKETIERFKMLKTSAIIIAGWCVIYCCYGLFFHLPGMWVEVFRNFETGGPVIHTGTNAIVDAFKIVNESKRYGDWGMGFLIWHSAYFSICVWISIYLIQAPRSKEISGQYNAKRTKIMLILIAIALITLIVLISIPAFT